MKHHLLKIIAGADNVTEISFIDQNIENSLYFQSPPPIFRTINYFFAIQNFLIRIQGRQYKGGTKQIAPLGKIFS